MAQDNWYDPSNLRIKWTPTRLKELADSLSDAVDKSVKAKTTFLLGDWCFENSFLPSYFGRYRERSKALDEAYEKAKEWQEHCLARGALFNQHNTRFASLWLANHHKWRLSGEAEDDRNAKLASDLKILAEAITSNKNIDETSPISETN